MATESKTHFTPTGHTAPNQHLAVDIDDLRSEVQAKYGDVAVDPDRDYHFHTGRFIAERCGYDAAVLDALPEATVESFAGVANPFALRSLEQGERIVDVGSGAGFDCFVAGDAVGNDGAVIGVDMTAEMLDKSRRLGKEIGADNVEFRHGYMEDLPVEDGWADVVIANGVFNLAPDKQQVFTEVWRVLKAGGVVQFADIANGREVPEEAMRHIDLWTG